MEKIYNKIIASKLFLLLIIGWVAISTSSCTFQYYTPDGGTFSGTTTYCEGATATDALNYSECSTSLGLIVSGVACTVQWYYNTTGGTSIATSTPLGAAIGFTSSSTGSGTLNYSPLTTTPGVFYYFAYITWGTGYCASPFTSGTQTITVNAPPGPITGPTSVCVGSAVTLNVPVSGGTWHSGTSSVATVTGLGVVTGVAPGSSVITYTATGCGSGASATVNVLAAPGAITGPPSVCQSSTITLSDPTAPGTWSSSAGPVASVDPSSGVVAGVTQGTAIITFTATNTCFATAHVTVNASPGTITGPATVCEGSSVTLSNPATGGTWSSGSTGVATVVTGSGLVHGVSPGTSVITYTNGCGSVSTGIGVNPLPSPITGTTSLCPSSTTTLSDPTSGGTWSSTSTVIATIGATSGVLTSGVTSGSATVSYTMPNSCAATALITVIPPLSPITGTAHVCTGQTTTLGATPAGGTWVSGDLSVATIGLSSGIVTGVTMGTAIMTYTAGIGCNNVKVVTVNPVAPVLGGDSVCQGLTTYLTNIVGGGNWSSTSPGVATVTFDSGKVTGVTPGTSVITYLLPTGCQSSATFRVIAFPAATTGTTRACPGTTTTLSNVTDGGVWSSNNTGIATVGSVSGIVTGVSADTVTIRYTIQPGCAATTDVIINPLPAPITGGIILCPGTIDTLQDITPGGLWSSSAPSIATVIDTSGVVITLPSGPGGSPVIRYTLPTGCLRTKTLSVFPAPVPLVTYNNGDMTFTTPNIYVSYQWYDSIVGEIAGATSYNLAALYNEYYYVVVTDTNGCRGTSAFIHFNPANVGVKTTTGNNGIRIYPNPTSGILYIQSQENVRAVINGIDGKKVLEQPNAKEINISNLADGTYFITLYSDSNEELSVQKFVKE